MLGISYGELFLILGAAVAVIGPKDLPIIARTAGRLAGRATGYVQMVRGEFEKVMEQSKARQVHKELQEVMTQVGTIGHQMRLTPFMNHSPSTTRLVDSIAGQPPVTNVDMETSKPPQESTETIKATKAMDQSATSPLSNIHRQATEYARLVESTPLTSQSTNVLDEWKDASGRFIVLPISAESADLLPGRKDDVTGSDVLLEAVLEEDYAHKAKSFFSQPSNH